MAKKSGSTPPKLELRDLVLGAEAELLKQAYEARLQVDGLLEERRQAYERIAELERQAEEIIGEEGSFPFPAPPLPVAGFSGKEETVTRNKPAPATAAKKTAATKTAAPAKPASEGAPAPGESSKPGDPGKTSGSGDPSPKPGGPSEGPQG